MGISGRCNGCFFLSYKKYSEEKFVKKAERRVEDLEINFKNLNWIEVYSDLCFSELKDLRMREKMSFQYRERFRLVILDIEKFFEAKKALRGEKSGIRTGLDYEISRALSNLKKI